MTFASAAGSPIIDRDALVECVRVDFGISLSSISQVVGGQDCDAVVLHAVTADGAGMAVKVSRSPDVSGLLASAYLAGCLSSGIPAPLRTRSGQSYSVVGGRRLSLSPWISGRAAYETGMDAQQWRCFGALLGEVHAAQMPRTVAVQLPTEDFRTPDAAIVRVLDERIHAQETLGNRAGSDDALTDALIREWCAAGDSLTAILAHIEDLGDELRFAAATFVLCHGDAHIGNVQLGDDGAVWLLDWDEIVSAPRERDLMFVIGGVLANAPVSPQQQAWFFDGYGPADIDPVLLAYHRCSWALQDVADYAARILDQPATSTHGGREALTMFCDLLSPTGIVTRAGESLQQIGRHLSGPGSRCGTRR